MRIPRYRRAPKQPVGAYADEAFTHVAVHVRRGDVGPSHKRWIPDAVYGGGARFFLMWHVANSRIDWSADLARLGAWPNIAKTDGDSRKLGTLQYVSIIDAMREVRRCRLMSC